MLQIVDKTKCCGCSACFNICSKQAIKMEYDSEGFLYPKIDNSICIKCGLCLKICPVLNNKKENKILDVYGAKNRNIDEQLKSSSGGMFSIFANYVLENYGIVFGASFNSNWKVVHKYIDKKEYLDSLRRSKYVQSDINITYKQAKQVLEENRLVLFTGTPCQIAGLKNFLQKDYENLLTIDIICHGVPSPKSWEKFLNENFDIKKIKYINFRDKKFGWLYFYLNIFEKNKNKKLYYFMNLIKRKGIFIQHFFYNEFLKAFLANLFLRSSCHQCYFKCDRNSDFTIGDLWGVNKILPEMYDNKGVSVLTINTEKAKQIFEKIKNNIEYEKINYNDMIKYNPAFVTSAKSHPKREEFFRKYKSENLNKLINSLLNEKILIIKLFRKVIKKICR